MGGSEQRRITADSVAVRKYCVQEQNIGLSIAHCAQHLHGVPRIAQQDYFFLLPCAECRRERYNEFRAAWLGEPSGLTADRKIGADEMDRALQAERAIRGGGKRTWPSHFAELPSGTFVERGGRAHLIWNGRLRPWTFVGYEDPVPAGAAAAKVTVLTPQSIVRIFRAGFLPQVDASAER